MSLEVFVSEKAPGVTNILLEGTLDAHTHAVLEKRVDEILLKNPQVIIFDLERLKFISSIGLRVIAKTKKTLKQSGGQLMLVNLQPQIKEVFDIINALPQEQIFKNVQELDEYLMVMQQRNIQARKGS